MVVVESGVKPEGDDCRNLRGQDVFIKVHAVGVTDFHKTFADVTCHNFFVVMPLVVRLKHLAVVGPAFHHKLFAHIVKTPSLHKGDRVECALEYAQKVFAVFVSHNVVLTKP